MASDKAYEGGGGCVGATCDAEDDGGGAYLMGGGGGRKREVRLGASVGIVPASSLEADFWKPIVLGSRWLGGRAGTSSCASSMQRLMPAIKTSDKHQSSLILMDLKVQICVSVEQSSQEKDWLRGRRGS